MTIQNLIPLLSVQMFLCRTFTGFPINDDGGAYIKACLSDEKNMDAEAVVCLNCKMALSSLIVDKGCPNCGGLDLDKNIAKVINVNEFKQQ